MSADSSQRVKNSSDRPANASTRLATGKACKAEPTAGISASKASNSSRKPPAPRPPAIAGMMPGGDFLALDQGFADFDKVG